MIYTYILKSLSILFHADVGGLSYPIILPNQNLSVATTDNLYRPTARKVKCLLYFFDVLLLVHQLSEAQPSNNAG
jgi:hypothetical protein